MHVQHSARRPALYRVANACKGRPDAVNRSNKAGSNQGAAAKAIGCSDMFARGCLCVVACRPSTLATSICLDHTATALWCTVTVLARSK